MVYRGKARRFVALVLCLALLLPLLGCSREAPEEAPQILVPEGTIVRAEDIRRGEEGLYLDSQLLLTVEPDTDQKTVEQLVAQAGGQILGFISFSGDYQIGFPEGKTYQELLSLTELWGSQDFVDRASLHRVWELQDQTVDYRRDPWLDTHAMKQNDGWDQSDPAGNNWWAEAIRMPDVWAMDIWQEASPGSVKLGVLDKGFDLSHPDLKDVATSIGYDGASFPDHGTAMAGLIGAQMGNDAAIAGVAACADPEMFVFGFAGDTSGAGNDLMPYPTDMVLKYGIALLLRQGCRAINISLGIEAMQYACEYGDPARKAKALEDLQLFKESLEQFLGRALEEGYDFLIIASAGNSSNCGWTEYPLSERTYGYEKNTAEYDEDGDRFCSVEYSLFGAIDDPVVRRHILIAGSACRNEALALLGGTGYVHSGFSAVGCDVYAPGEEILSLTPGAGTTRKEPGTSQATAIVTGVAGLVWAAAPELSAEQVRSILIRCARYEPEEPGLWEESVRQIDIVDAALAVGLALETEGQSPGQTVTDGAVVGYAYSETDDTGEQIFDNVGEPVHVPMVEQTVTFTAQDGTVTEVVTNQWGSFDVFLAPGTYTVRLEVEHFWPYEETLTLEQGDVQDLIIKLKHMPPVSEGFHSHSASYMYDGGVVFDIPRVDLPGDLAAAVNAQIYAELSPFVTTEQITTREGMAFRWHKKGDIISILVRANEDTEWGLMDVYVYNVSSVTGQRLEASAVYEAFGYDRAWYEDRLKALIDADYPDVSYAYDMSQTMKDTILAQRDKTYSQENLDAAMPYIDEDGDLCVVIKFHVAAAHGYQYHLYKLTGKGTADLPPLKTCHECGMAGEEDSPYWPFLRDRCYVSHLDARQEAEGYRTLDLDGNGVEELILDLGWKTEAFHDHLVFTINDLGQVVRAGDLYSWSCLTWSESRGELGYIYPRASELLVFHTVDMDVDVLYHTQTLYHDRPGQRYSVAEVDGSGQEQAAREVTQAQFDAIFDSFQPISWKPMPERSL